ncbi:MAG TPA: tautomerase family protein, partial [Candidatus Dormibacteraeota bacterium]|nr:tautomerase family protein [Candidatus Dormibacteraeota bacterium]
MRSPGSPVAMLVLRSAAHRKETTQDAEEGHMPLVRFDLYAGRREQELKKLLDTAHSVLVEVFKLPVRDRY